VAERCVTQPRYKGEGGGQELAVVVSVEAGDHSGEVWSFIVRTIYNGQVRPAADTLLVYALGGHLRLWTVSEPPISSIRTSIVVVAATATARHRHPAGAGALCGARTAGDRATDGGAAVHGRRRCRHGCAGGPPRAVPAGCCTQQRQTEATVLMAGGAAADVARAAGAARASGPPTGDARGLCRTPLLRLLVRF
jgi:hypothetical protein